MHIADGQKFMVKMKIRAHTLHNGLALLLLLFQGETVSHFLTTVTSSLLVHSKLLQLALVVS